MELGEYMLSIFRVHRDARIAFVGVVLGALVTIAVNEVNSLRDHDDRLIDEYSALTIANVWNTLDIPRLVVLIGDSEKGPSEAGGLVPLDTREWSDALAGGMALSDMPNNLSQEAATTMQMATEANADLEYYRQIAESTSPRSPRARRIAKDLVVRLNAIEPMVDKLTNDCNDQRNAARRTRSIVVGWLWTIIGLVFLASLAALVQPEAV